MAVGSINPTSDGTVSYCSITNCASEGGDILCVTQFSYSNILNNNGKNSIIKSSSTSVLDNCCIMNNKCKYAFYSSSGSITVNLCTVNTKTAYGNVVFNKDPTNPSYNKLSMLKLELCEAFVDKVTFTPKRTPEPTPAPTPEPISVPVVSFNTNSESSQEKYFISTHVKETQIKSDNMQENGDNLVTKKDISNSNNNYIIIACAAAGVFAIIIVAAVMWAIIRKKNTNDSSGSLSFSEELVVVNKENETIETHENGLWTTSNELSDDPFKNDFEEAVIETLFQNQ